MPPVRKILLADPDPTTARALGPALRQRGYQVHTARDGARALQIAILRFPDVVLFDERCQLLDVRTFVRILRTNPRTERIPVVFTGDSVDADRARLGTFLCKPFNLDEVLARIEQVFRRVEASRAVSSESREIEGNLAQIPLVDLLQILAVNRKTGRLAVEREGERAEIVLAEGRGWGRPGARRRCTACSRAAKASSRSFPERSRASRGSIARWRSSSSRGCARLTRWRGSCRTCRSPETSSSWR